MRIYSPCEGKVQDLKYVNDIVFSKYMMGVGFFIETNDKDILAPIDGIVEYVAETSHALVIKKDNINIMVHIGLDTCHLKGTPFNVLVKEGEHVSLNQKIVEVDHKAIKESDLNSDVIVVIVENKDETLLANLPNEVKPGDVIMDC